MTGVVGRLVFPAYSRHMKRRYASDAAKVLALATLTMFSLSLHAQSVDEVKSAFLGLVVQDKVMQATLENLAPMAIGRDQEAVSLIVSSIAQFREHLDAIYAVGLLLGKMRGPEDAKAAREQLQQSLGVSIKRMDITLQFTNTCLAALKSPAAVAEATKARDAMVASREQLRTLSQ